MEGKKIFPECPIDKDCDFCQWFIEEEGRSGACAITIIGTYFYKKILKQRENEK